MSTITAEQRVAWAREGFMRPTVEKLVDQYHRGLLTVGELTHSLWDLDYVTPDTLPEWEVDTDATPELGARCGECFDCRHGTRCEVNIPTLDGIPALTGIQVIDVILAHSEAARLHPERPTFLARMGMRLDRR